jgi:pilus assembly protein Flp/PilA
MRFNFGEILSPYGGIKSGGKDHRWRDHTEPLMLSFLKRLARDEAGVTAIEYGLIAAGIGVAIITVVNTAGSSLASIFTAVSNDLSTAAK